MSDLETRLQAAVGDAFRLERELGGGGMSRVFLAEERRLGRRVVIKVLPPEMAAGVSIERFEREIQLAAKLQHPTSYRYSPPARRATCCGTRCPSSRGNPLRARLAREGELPITQTIRILRDVADALAYAHRHGVVHRDIKPDNVLLSDGHAVVTDFGVAKAVSESTGEKSLTSLGVALGTPSYMAPEQAAADPHVDHRADIYAFGAFAYEMLTGRPPFTGMNAQAVLAAHLTQAPEPVTQHRTAVPESLSQVVMKCLEKRAADRWQRADELRAELEGLATPTAGLTPAGTQPVMPAASAAGPAPEHHARHAHPVRVAALFGVGAAAVLLVVYGLMIALGLPDWVFLGAVMLLAIGLPIMLLTGHHEHRRAAARGAGVHVTTPAGLERHFTFRKALMGGGLAFSSLTVLTGGFLGLRAMGVGPFGTLITSGVLGVQERLILADFENATGDSMLGGTVTELLRIDLTQSPVVSVMEGGQLAEIMALMQRSRDEPLTPELAKEIATREGIKAYVHDDVRPLGRPLMSREM